MRTVITVLGKDMVGILTCVSAICAKNQINMIEVTQSVLQDMFTMIMMMDISKSTIPSSDLAGHLTELGASMNLTIHTMHKDIFNSIHRV